MNIQQLRAQIAALQDATMDGNKNFRSGYDEGKFDALSAVDALLDSLQEEPVSVWHDGNTLPINYEIEDILVVYNQYGREYLHLYWEDGIYSDAQGLSKYNWKYVEKWAYIKDLLKLDNPCKIGKNLQEEPDYCCGECAKWVDGKGCSREKQNTHCITDAACEEGVRRSSKQKKPKFKVGDTIKAIDSCLGSPRTICEVCDSWYVTNQGTLDFEFEDNWELVEEPVSESLNDYAKEILSWEDSNEDWDRLVIRKTAKHFTDWQKEQFEKNRLAACDRQTEEEAEREQDFVMGIIENEHRKPTFDDAIKYGMRLQRENMMNGAIEVEVKEDAGGYPYIEPDIELYDYDKDAPTAKAGDKVKLIIIKED